MNKYIANCLIVIRKIIARIKGIDNSSIKPFEVSNDSEIASELLYYSVIKGTPCMVARFGSFELNTILNVRSICEQKHSIWQYLTSKTVAFWWDEELRYRIQNNAGFFPPTNDMLIKYKERMFSDIEELDILGDFCRSVKYIEDKLIRVKRVHLKDLEPIYGSRPWTRALRGKRVLVVHPFAELIKEQYSNKRSLLFKNDDLLPEFHLEVIQAVQSLGGENNDFKDWFEALNWMENEIDKHDYDVCLIGCGAYGFCLAAHCKRMGKIGIHLGGFVQFLFGIIGNRWTDPYYGVKEWGIEKGTYSDYINVFWIRPDNSSRPSNSEKVENACYW